MSVTRIDCRIVHVPASGQRTFSFPFPALEEETNAYIRAYFIDPEKHRWAPDYRTLVGGVTVTPNKATTTGGWIGGGTVTIPVDVPDGMHMEIRRETAVTQLLDFFLQQKMTPDQVEWGFDKLVMILQEQDVRGELEDIHGALYEIAVKLDEIDSEIAEIHAELAHIRHELDTKATWVYVYDLEKRVFDKFALVDRELVRLDQVKADRAEVRDLEARITKRINEVEASLQQSIKDLKAQHDDDIQNLEKNFDERLFALEAELRKDLALLWEYAYLLQQNKLDKTEFNEFIQLYDRWRLEVASALAAIAVRLDDVEAVAKKSREDLDAIIENILTREGKIFTDGWLGFSPADKSVLIRTRIPITHPHPVLEYGVGNRLSGWSSGHGRLRSGHTGSVVLPKSGEAADSNYISRDSDGNYTITTSLDGDLLTKVI